jgi:hypothetical protein
MPLFILSTWRSGGSVLAAMLGQHPELYAFPELNVLLAETISDLFKLDQRVEEECGWPTNYQTAGSIHAVAELEIGNQSPEAIDAATRWLRQRGHWSTRRFVDHLLELVEPKIGVIKTNQAGVSGLFLDRIATAYPHGRFLHLTRHPLSACNSLQRFRRTMPLRFFPSIAGVERSLERDLREWCYFQRNILAFGGKQSPARFLRVRAEDILTGSDSALAGVASWLGVATDATAISGLRRPERAVFSNRLRPEWETDDASVSQCLRSIGTTPSLASLDGGEVEHAILAATVDLARLLGYH